MSGKLGKQPEAEFEAYQPELERWDKAAPEKSVRRLDTLRRLLNGNQLTAKEFVAGILYRKIIEDYFAMASGMAKLSDEMPPVGGDGDPIRLYVKGRRVYRPTQRPRNVSRARTSFDGWSADRSKALKRVHRLRYVLAQIDEEARRALYGMVVSPDDPHLRPQSVSGYSMKRYGFKDTRYNEVIIADLKRALSAIDSEYDHLASGYISEELEEAA